MHLRQDIDGLVCAKCHRFSCKKCLEVIAGKATRHNDWCRIVREYLDGKQIPSSFVGHCCEWQQVQEVSNCKKERRFDGYIYFPEFSIMINPNFHGVDIHALGRDPDHNLDAVVHAVVNEDVAVECKSLNIIPDRSSARIVDLYTKQIEHDGSQTKVQNVKINMGKWLVTVFSLSIQG